MTQFRGYQLRSKWGHRDVGHFSQLHISQHSSSLALVLRTRGAAWDGSAAAEGRGLLWELPAGPGRLFWCLFYLKIM